MKITDLALLICILLGFILGSAQGQAEGPSPEDLKVAQAAKTHAYTGGIDQEPLVVQSQLPVVNRKMKPAQEPLEIPDESPEPATSND